MSGWVEGRKGGEGGDAAKRFCRRPTDSSYSFLFFAFADLPWSPSPLPFPLWCPNLPSHLTPLPPPPPPQACWTSRRARPTRTSLTPPPPSPPGLLDKWPGEANAYLADPAKYTSALLAAADASASASGAEGAEGQRLEQQQSLEQRGAEGGLSLEQRLELHRQLRRRLDAGVGMQEEERSEERAEEVLVVDDGPEEAEELLAASEQ